MCAPVMAVMAIASAAMAAYSTYQSGQSQKAAGDYNSRVAENNAKIAESGADDARRAGAFQAEQANQRTKQVIGTQRAMAAAGGVNTDTGTTGLLTEESARMGELDALTAINNAHRSAYGMEVNATNSLAQGTLDRYVGNSAARGGMLSAGGTLLGGASNAYYNYSALTKGAPAAGKLGA